MGWWDEGDLTLGDEPLDRLIHALEQVREAYRTEFGREPTHAEVARLTETALRGVLDAASDNARVEAAVKIRAKPMKKQRVAVGDVFAIPLAKCHFGRVIYKKPYGTWLELYKQTAARPLPVRRVDTSPKNVKHHKWVIDGWVFEDFRWKVIGNVPVPADYEFPDILMGDMDLTHAVRGPEGRQMFFPTRKEVLKRHIEPICLLPRETIEANLAAGRPDPWPEILESLESKQFPK